MSEDLTFIFKHPFELFMIIFLVLTGVHYKNINSLDDLTKAYAEITAVSGGFTTYQYNAFLSDLESIGFDKEHTIIIVKATSPSGDNISSKVMNVTPQTQNPYPANPVYVPRGSKIELIVTSSRKSLLNSIYKCVNIQSNISLGSSRRVYMSERVE